MEIRFNTRLDSGICHLQQVSHLSLGVTFLKAQSIGCQRGVLPIAIGLCALPYLPNRREWWTLTLEMESHGYDSWCIREIHSVYPGQFSGHRTRSVSHCPATLKPYLPTHIVLDPFYLP